jgi:hypothetical protein
MRFGNRTLTRWIGERANNGNNVDARLTSLSLRVNARTFCRTRYDDQK